MLKSLVFAMLLFISVPAIVMPVMGEVKTSTDVAIAAENLKLAEQIAQKLMPDGSHEKILSSTMTGPMMDQILSMNIDKFGSTKGEGLAEIGTKNDPHFKERFEITMKVMVSEIGKVITKIEPKMRATLSEIYFEKYDAKQLSDINTFLNTPSGKVFADNYMSSFIDPKMLEFSLAMMPSRMEELPQIIKKVEAATAHLPSPPKFANTEGDSVSDIVQMLNSLDEPILDNNRDAANETGNEPWYDGTNWTAAQQNKITKLSDAYTKTQDKNNTAYDAYEAAEKEAIGAARKRFLAEGWKPEPQDEDAGATATPAEGATAAEGTPGAAARPK